jgi:hypothetical protein
VRNVWTGNSRRTNRPDAGRAGKLSDSDEPEGDDDDEAPETPLDEPRPTPVQDPPAEPDPQPYVVSRIYEEEYMEAQW